jgi:hypothetical protein
MSSLSSPLQSVVALFTGPLQGVRFADIDGDGLSALASEVESLNGEVEAHEAHLAQLRETLTQKQEMLLALAQQALAYARIYAEGDETLSAELNEIALPRATKPRKSTAPKTASERGTKPSKEDVTEAPVDASDDESTAEAVPPSGTKTKRKGAESDASSRKSAEPEAPSEPVAATASRRKIPARRGR